MTPQLNILVVEDNDQIRESLAQQLAGASYTVTTAANGNEAIPLLHGHEYTLVVLDLNMPYIDGFSVLQFVKSTFPNTRVIILTARRDLSSIERCRSLGADEVLWKPFDIEELLAVIGRLTVRN
jgi:DNA-binding response OmpR family regulator